MNYYPPIIIVNFNRLESTKQLYKQLVDLDLARRIHIIDNKSTYPPLLEWYKSLPFHNKMVHYMDDNKGPYVLNELLDQEPFKSIVKEHYVYTDSDINLGSVPYYFIDSMIMIQRITGVDKVGLSLKIDDIPDHYNRKQEVIDWEKQHWVENVRVHGVMTYKAAIDTTFAVCKPGLKCGWTDNALRTEYLGKHTPWYNDSSNLPEDEKYMREEIRKNQGNPKYHQSYHWSTK
jgi:hypothetical protein